jgi:hypothetical protein
MVISFWLMNGLSFTQWTQCAHFVALIGMVENMTILVVEVQPAALLQPVDLFTNMKITTR